MPNIQRFSNPCSRKASPFRYVHIGNHGKKNLYLCLGQNPLVLFWLLYWYGKPFGIRGRGIIGTIHALKIIFHWVGELIYEQLRSAHTESPIELPVFGQLCLRVHNGYKVFDFRRGLVAKLFSRHVKMAGVRREINRVRRAAAYEFAPTLHRWDLRERCYEEEYVNGASAGRSTRPGFLNIVQNVLIPLLERIVLASRPREVKASNYASELLEKILQRQSELVQNGLNPDKLRSISEFVEATVDRLQMKQDQPVYLVFSHGDFNGKHVLISAAKTVVVDWEYSRYRSLLFDLYNYSFKKCRRRGVLSDIPHAIDAAVCRLHSYLTLHGSAEHRSMLASLSAVETYRLTYFAEYIGLHMLESANVSQRTLEEILLMIDTYRRYEVMLGNHRDLPRDAAETGAMV